MNIVIGNTVSNSSNTPQALSHLQGFAYPAIFSPCPSTPAILGYQANSHSSVLLWSITQMQGISLSFGLSQIHTYLLFDYSGIMVYIGLPPLEAGTLSSSNPWLTSEKAPSCLLALSSFSTHRIVCPETIFQHKDGGVEGQTSMPL